MGSVECVKRLCERPGCSESASVAYGMQPADLVFWLDVLGDAVTTDTRVLCRRHADSMVVPKGWTLDDLRDPDLHLFRPPESVDPGRGPSVRQRQSQRGQREQLEFDRPTAEPSSQLTGQPENEPVVNEPVENEPVDHESASGTGHVSEPWTPVFDADDDLEGLLAATSPLLARAFRGASRPRQT